MHAAFTFDQTEATRLLLSGEDPNAIDSSGKTALFHAVASEHSNAHLLITELIQHGALMNTKDNSGFTFIDHAAARNATQVLHSAVDAIDAATKEGKNTIGLLIRIDDPGVRAMLKEKLGSKHFKYFDNKFRKKSKKTHSSAASNKSSCNSFAGLKFGEKESTIKANDHTGNAVEKRKNGSGKGDLIEPFSLREANEIRSQGVGDKKARGKPLSHWLGEATHCDDLPKANACKNHRGWLDDEVDSQDAKLNFKTMDLIRTKVDAVKKQLDTDIDLSVSQKAVEQLTNRKSGGLEDDVSGKLLEKEADFEKVYRQIEVKIGAVLKVN